MVISNPKCMVSIPNWLSSGRKIGVRIRVAEIISINMPMTSSRILTASKKTQGEEMLLTTAVAILLGICSKVRYSPKTEAPATITSSVAEVTAEETTTRLTSYNFMSRWMQISTKKA